MLGTTAHRLSALHRAHLAALAPKLAKLGLHPGQELLLAEVARREDITQVELAERLAVKPPTVTKVLNGLERAGLVTRTHDPDDGRVLRVALTAAGRRLMPALRGAWDDAERELLAALSPIERGELDRLLHSALRPRRAGQTRT